MIKKILASIDLSEANKPLIDWALSFSDKFNASLDIVHVEVPFPILPIEGYEGLISQPMLELRRGMIEEMFESIKEEAKRKGIEKLNLITLKGAVEEEVTRYAQDNGHDLIIIGHYGESGRRELGSKAYRILAKSKIPVLVVSSHCPEEIRKILLPVDFSEYSFNALKYAFHMSKVFNSELHLLHIIEIYEALSDSEAVMGLIDKMKEKLKEFVEKEAEAVKFFVHVDKRFGAVLGILDFIDSLNPDLIVMGSRGRTGLSMLFIGSVTEKILRTQTRPTLVVTTSK